MHTIIVNRVRQLLQCLFLDKKLFLNCAKLLNIIVSDELKIAHIYIFTLYFLPSKSYTQYLKNKFGKG